MSASLRLTVLGTGYPGITHASCMASLGFEVLGVDTDAVKVEMLSAGVTPIYEPGLAELVREQLDSGRLRFTTSYKHAASFGDVHFICAGTPQLPGGGGADLSQVASCVTTLAPLLDKPSLIVGKSTVPVGTAREFGRYLADAGAPAEPAWNPEFLREGSAVRDTLAPDRIVIGVTSAHAADVLRQVYAPLLKVGTPFFTTSLETAELAKAAANAFLATKISFIKAMAEVCEAADANIVELSAILGADPRIGRKFLRAGLGFGGGCLPKDIRGLMSRADELGVQSAVGLLREVDKINLRRRSRTADLALELMGGDITGAPVRVYDPVGSEKAAAACPELQYPSSFQEAAAGAMVVLLLTDRPGFAALPPDDLAGLVKRKNIVDARNVLTEAAWLDAGWNYRAFGIGAGSPGMPAGKPSSGCVRQE